MDNYLNSHFDLPVLALLNLDSLPDDYNPVTRALKENPADFVAGVKAIKKACRDDLARLAILAQTKVFDWENGPDQDGERKGLRRHWYAWYKGDLAQPLSEALGEDIQDKNWQTNWVGRQSTVCKNLVFDEGLTYHQLWIKDSDRMMATQNKPLFSGCHIILVVEKNSLFDDFQRVCKRLGAKALYSSKGKSSCAAIEKILRDGWYWDTWHDPFSADNPLYIIHLSDYDYDGHAVIGPTVGEQCRRYTPHTREARIGINPEQVTEAGYELADKWYQISTGHQAAKDWAETMALEKKYGFEIEALRTPTYYPLLVKALLSILDFDYVVERLREDCRPNVWWATDLAKLEILSRDDEYQHLKSQLDAYEQMVDSEIERLADELADDVEPPEGEPTELEYISWVENTYQDTPWRPFSEDAQTNALARLVIDQAGDFSFLDFEAE